MFPRARRDNLLVREMGDEVVVYDLAHHRAHCLTRTAAQIWRLCDGEKTVAELARAVEQDLHIPVDEEVVWLVLNRLERAHLLRDLLLRPREIAGVSRRQAISLGLAGAASLLLHGCGVDSVTAPTPTATPQAANPTVSGPDATQSQVAPAAPSPTPAPPLCCHYSGGPTLVKDCPKKFTCEGPPAMPVITDIRCEHKKCPDAVNVNRRCKNSKGEFVKGPKCTYEVTTPTCLPGCA